MKCVATIYYGDSLGIRAIIWAGSSVCYVYDSTRKSLKLQGAVEKKRYLNYNMHIEVKSPRCEKEDIEKDLSVMKNEHILRYILLAIEAIVRMNRIRYIIDLYHVSSKSILMLRVFLFFISSISYINILNTKHLSMGHRQETQKGLTEILFKQK